MRPPSQGDGALGLDCERLSAILRRVYADPRRTGEEKEKIGKLIKRLMTLLLERSDKAPRSKKNGSRAHSA
jgi:hypothetical protein